MASSSSESDDEYVPAKSMTRSQNEVFEFINKASVLEFSAVKSFTKNRIEAIMEKRPFRTWKGMKSAFSTLKFLHPGEFLDFWTFFPIF